MNQSAVTEIFCHELKMTMSVITWGFAASRLSAQYLTRTPILNCNMLSVTRLVGVILLSISSFNEASIISPGHVSRQAPSPPPSSPTLTFKPPSDRVITCNSSTFSWDYSGPDLRMSLFVTNRGVQQLDPPSLPSPPTPSPTSTAPLGAVSLVLALSTFEGLAPIRDTTFTWPIVAIGRGWYVLEAELRAANYTSRGSPFFVEESGDIGCLTVMPPHDQAPTSGASLRHISIFASKTGILGSVIGLICLSVLVGT